MVVMRHAGEGDLAEVVALTARWAAEPTTTGHYPHNTVQALRQDLGGYFWVAEADGGVVGFALGRLNGSGVTSMHYQVLDRGEDHLSLEQLYVRPDHRGRGIGGRLVSCVLSAAEEQGIACCLLVSQSTDWSRTLRFYQRQGFRPWFLAIFTGQSTQERASNTG